VGTSFERPPETAEAAALPSPGGLSASAQEARELPAPPTLASLPVGARLVMRCRRDWRAATVASVEPDCVRLNVASPTGHTYRVRRPPDAPLTYEGALPLLGEVTPAGWRVALARYDLRW
jgi:hypothetical protein